MVAGTRVGGLYYDVTLDTQGMIDGTRVVDRELDKIKPKFNALAIAVAVLAASLAALKMAKAADDMRLMGARVEVAAGSIESASLAMSRLEAISRTTQTAVAGNVEVFTRLNQSMIQMGGTQNDTLNMVELLAKAIKVSGASAVEAKAAMLQFGQAMGSGKLQGDELRSMMETAPYLMRKMAEGIGVPVGALKKLGEEGKLTADVVANALTKAAAQIDEDFKKFPQTIESSMDGALDAASRANAKFDELSGTSVALTGVTKGLGETLDKLAEQFGAANTEAGTLGRNDKIKTWADGTRLALSYLADGADILWQTISVLGRNVAYVFTGIGNEIGAIGAQAMAVARGDFAGAAAIGDAVRADAERRRKELDAADSASLSKSRLAGQQMRDAWEAGAGGGRGSVNPSSAASTLKSGKTDDGAAKKAASKAMSAQVYLDGLVIANKSGLDRIDAEEKKALDENKKRMIEDAANASIYEKAKFEIKAKYANERLMLEKKTAEDLAAVEDRNEAARAEARILLTENAEMRILFIRDEAMRQAEAAYKRGRATFEEAETAKTQAIQRAIDDEKALRLSRQDYAIGTLGITADNGDPAAKEKLLIAQAAREQAANLLLQETDLANAQIYADRKVAIEQKLQDDIKAVRESANQAAMTSQAEIFGSLLSITKNAAGEQSGLYKVMFAAQKAFSIAQAIVAIQTGIANAAAMPWPLNLGAMASVAAATASIVSTIAGTNISGGRQYGGVANSGNMYRVNEKGAPEMFTAANGKQFIVPTQSGRVTAADQIGGGTAVSIVVNNTASGVSVTPNYDEQSRTVTIAVNEVAQQIRENSGPVWSAMRSASNVQPRV
jgi:tape measure domain-containing protein